jgi:hypothetical protein
VRIEYAKQGGIAYIPALAAPVTIDTDTLPPEQARDLEQLVKGAAFFTLPENVGALRSGAADYQTYTITIHDQGRSHTIRVTDLGERPEVAGLVRALQKHAKEIKRGTPG